MWQVFVECRLYPCFSKLIENDIVHVKNTNLDEKSKFSSIFNWNYTKEIYKCRLLKLVKNEKIPFK